MLENEIVFLLSDRLNGTESFYHEDGMEAFYHEDENDYPMLILLFSAFLNKFTFERKYIVMLYSSR